MNVQLRELLHKLKGRSGLNDIYQSHKNIIPETSLVSFLRMAQINRQGSSTPGSVIPGKPPVDFYARGTEKLRSDAINNRLARFHWPSPGEHISIEAQMDEEVTADNLVSKI